MKKYFIPDRLNGIDRKLGPFEINEIIDWCYEAEPNSLSFDIAVPLGEVVLLSDGRETWLTGVIIEPNTLLIDENDISVSVKQIPEFISLFKEIGIDLVISEFGEVPDFIKMFPSVEDVFVNPSEKIKEHCYPIFSINLSILNAEWDVWVHFVDYFVDNEEPILDKELYNVYKGWDPLREMIYSLDVNNKYTMEHGEVHFNVSEDWKKWHEEAKQGYINLIANFYKYKVLSYNKLESEQAIEHASKYNRTIAFQFGGKTGRYGEDYVEQLSKDSSFWQQDESPLFLICRVETNDATNLLYYQPKHKRVIQFREFG